MRNAMIAGAVLAAKVAGAATVTVEIHHFAFNPGEITIEAGDTVRWENHDGIEHTATSQTGPGTLVPSGVFHSGLLSMGQAYEHRFTQTGRFYYFCVPHGSSMQGVISVVPNCAADFNEDGGVDGSDVVEFFAAWESGAERADVNEDGGVDGGDVGAFFEVWERGGCR